jgi:hypothetical protein
MLEAILTDESIKNEGLEFVNKIIMDDKFVGDILQLLLGALKNEDFLRVCLF